ncbi:spore germination protein [Cytobacillus dafuensis]|uniref:Spore germination protein n=1 Tax=Cytobacillus dafuensis TaxID=1742359 RepID=A0A5B8Z1N8_CYTDA|nr:spore germination protein [Cytobacillus dafuensis]QED46751.1 spore germination protein [Cytobacillus dafuensis]
MIWNKHSKKSHLSQNVNTHVTGNYHLDLTAIKQKLGENSDVQYREFKLKKSDISAVLIFLDGLSDKELIDTDLLRQLMMPFNLGDLEILEKVGTKDFIKNYVLSISDIQESNDIKFITTKILNGSAALFIDGSQDVLILGLKKEKTRNLMEPLSESLVRGPRIGFTESLSDNTAILRNSGENEDLTLLKISVGKRSKKDLVIAYINEIVNPKLLEEIKRRVKSIDLDYLAESGYVEQLIEDNFLSPFPQIQSTERPDRVISALMEGRVAILLDGSPFVLIAPVTFGMLLQSPEDYYERWIPGSLIRMLRFITAFISLFAPALYISFVSFHPGLIPTKLAISMAGFRQGVPFPAFIEAIIMEVAIEILREAGLRLPKPIGQAVGIVGGLIIGEAAVQAGIVSPIMVIVVALTAISSFAIPQYSSAIALRYLRFIAMLGAAMLGLYGVVLFFLLLCSHLVRLKSFGVPYTSPAVPFRLRDLQDFIIRMPMFMMNRRPMILDTKDSKRKE